MSCTEKWRIRIYRTLKACAYRTQNVAAWVIDSLCIILVYVPVCKLSVVCLCDYQSPWTVRYSKMITMYHGVYYTSHHYTVTVLRRRSSSSIVSRVDVVQLSVCVVREDEKINLILFSVFGLHSNSVRALAGQSTVTSKRLWISKRVAYLIR